MDQSVHAFFGDFVDLDDSVAIADEETGSDVVPGDGGHGVVLLRLDLLGFNSRHNFFELEVTISDSGGILGFEIPDFYLQNVFNMICLYF